MEVLQSLQNNPQTIVLLTGAQLREFAMLVVEEALEHRQNEKAAQPEETLLTSKQARAAFHVSTATLWRWVKAGILHTKKAGNKNLFLESELKRAIGL